jgi:hypothetical protein
MSAGCAGNDELEGICCLLGSSEYENPDNHAMRRCGGQWDDDIHALPVGQQQQQQQQQHQQKQGRAGREGTKVSCYAAACPCCCGEHSEGKKRF